MCNRVLVIDDEPIICLGVQKMIDWQGYGYSEVALRYTFEDGLSAALTGRYSLVVTDIRIHEYSGLELVKIVKQQGKCDCFVVMSAYEEFEYARTALHYGVRRYLLKPINRDELIKCAIEAAGGGACPAGAPSAAPKIQGERPAPPEEDAAAWDGAPPPQAHKALSAGEIIEYIHSHYADSELSVAAAAKKLYVHPTYLGQCFIKQTGARFSEYLNRVRIEKACGLLLDNSLLLYEICEGVGFRNIAYFHRVFKRVTGYSTAEYKRRAYAGTLAPPPRLEGQGGAGQGGDSG